MVRFAYALLAALLFVNIAIGQTIDGPDEVDLKTPAWFGIAGLNDTQTVAWFPNDCLETGPPHIVGNHGLFWADETGSYTVSAVVAWIEGTMVRIIPLSKTIQVGGEPDPPIPDPNPDPDPPTPEPGAKYQVMFFTDKAVEDNMTLDQVTLLNGLKIRDEIAAAGHKFQGCYNSSSEAQAKWPVAFQQQCFTDRFGRQTCMQVPVKKPPAEIGEAWWAKVRGDPMPRIAIAPLAGGEIRDFPLPANREALFAFLEDPK